MADDTRPIEASVTDRLDTLFAPWARTDEPGLVAGVVKDGRLIYRRAFGMASLEHAVANTPTTRMRIGSISKHFTCLLALLLAEESKLDLDQPIRAYIPELAGPGGDPTPRQLMQHRGGSRCYLDLGFIGHGFSLPPLGTVLKAQARQQGRNFAPGEAMIYNNGGYNLVSIAIERVGGAPFEDQLKARLFDVVGMPDTASVPTDPCDLSPCKASRRFTFRVGAGAGGAAWSGRTSCAAKARSFPQSTTCCAGWRTFAPGICSGRHRPGRSSPNCRGTPTATWAPTRWACCSGNIAASISCTIPAAFQAARRRCCYCPTTGSTCS